MFWIDVVVLGFVCGCFGLCCCGFSESCCRASGGFLGATLFACGSLLRGAWFGLVVAGFRRIDFDVRVCNMPFWFLVVCLI